jgi:CHAT domain-containing protein/tetratricopeptide (TPR) repeat protein
MLIKYLLSIVVIPFACTVTIAASPTIITAQNSSESTTETKSLLDTAESEIKNTNYPEAIESLKKALTIFENRGDRQKESQVLMKLGIAYSLESNYQRAIEYYQKSLQITREIKDWATEVNVLGYLGNVYRTLGNYADAIDLHQQALKISQKINDPARESNARINLGNDYASKEEYSKALEYYQQALIISKRIKNLSIQSIIFSNLGNLYRVNKEYSIALREYEQALKISRQTNNRLDEGAILFNLGDISLVLKKYSDALSYYEQALKISREFGINSSNESATLSNLADIYLELKNYPKAIIYYQQALKISRESGDPLTEGVTLAHLGNVYRILEKYSDALDYYQQSLQISRKYNNKITQEYRNKGAQGYIFAYLGFVHYKLHQLPTAIDYLEQAAQIADDVRINLGDEDKVSLFQTQLLAYKLLSETLWIKRDFKGSLIATERGRARIFSELLNQRLEANPTISKPEPLDFAQIQAQARSRQATIISYSILPAFDRTLVSSVNYQSYKLLIHVISSNGELTVRESLIPKNLELAQIVNQNRTKLLEFQPLIAQNSRGFSIKQLKIGMEVRLTGDPLETRRRVVKIDPSTQSVTLKSLDPTVPDDVIKLSQIIAPASKKIGHPELRQLHQLLITPIADLLPRDPLAPVIFIPDGALYEVPFAALTNERGEYLIDLHTISISPSLAVLSQTAKLKQRNISRTAPSLVVGNPDFSKHQPAYPPLQFSENEARQVADLFPSKKLLLANEATESAVKRWLPSARIAHFATHGFRDVDKGLDSGIILTSTGNENGILTARKVLNLSLNADLVVLSACDTGRGQITGDGVIGLSRSFITAGTSSVIASLWLVDDQATSVLMTDFYRQWQGGKGKAQALRTAMLNTKSKYPDPYFWSSMSLYGEID